MANSTLVTGSTGNQGGAVINALLSAPDISDVSIFALTRDPESAGARALVAKAPGHITLVKGNLDDCEAIFEEASKPIKAVFFVSINVMSPWAKNHGEEIQGKAMVDAALKNGVKHFVFTSVDRHGVDSDSQVTDIPHFKSKANIERYLREKSANSRMSWTILRPVAFLDNVAPGFAGKIFPTVWKVGLSPTTKLQVVVLADIGWFGAQALLRPKDFAGRAISLASDELTFGEANAIFKEKVGYDIPVTYGFIASALLWISEDVGNMFKFFEDVGYAADIPALRKEYPGLHSFADYIENSSFVMKK